MTVLARLALAAALGLDAGAGAWTVGVTTTGGFTGMGRGDLLVHANGELTARRASRPGRSGGPCSGRLSDTEMQRIAAAVLGSKPAGWASAGLKGTAPDAFRYVLEMRRGEETQKATWYDNTAGRMPPDLAELYAAVDAAWQRVVKACDES